MEMKNRMKYLIQLGANVNHRNHHSETSFFDVCKNGNKRIIIYLIEHRTEISNGNWYRETPISIE